ncbi:glycosyltransferase family 2 protein [Turicimonas muris]|uniref:glycosyltransferase family 2 protein n=1 Tax=Turicimonas muris TaxID=1796652 RepID=UPI00248CFD26|nr:glycosyltransferase family 2 protein [Turicimonas muris]
MKITAYVMAKNEEDTIKECLSSLLWCDEVVLADTGSTDKTIEIAKSLGVTIMNIEFQGFGPTRNQIINNIDSDWIVCFDADEICTAALAKEIKDNITNHSADVFLAPRINYLLKQKIHHSGWNPDIRHAVAFRSSCYSYTEDSVHESYRSSGTVKQLSEPFAHFSFRKLSQMMKKEKEYSELGVQNVLKRKKKISMGTAVLHGTSAFFRHFILRRGFLDGWAGFIIATSSAHATFFRYAMAYEKNANLEIKDFKVEESLK